MHPKIISLRRLQYRAHERFVDAHPGDELPYSHEAVRLVETGHARYDQTATPEPDAVPAEIEGDNHG